MSPRRPAPPPQRCPRPGALPIRRPSDPHHPINNQFLSLRTAAGRAPGAVPLPGAALGRGLVWEEECLPRPEPPSGPRARGAGGAGSWGGGPQFPQSGEETCRHPSCCDPPGLARESLPGKKIGGSGGEGPGGGAGWREVRERPPPPLPPAAASSLRGSPGVAGPSRGLWARPAKRSAARAGGEAGREGLAGVGAGAPGPNRRGRRVRTGRGRTGGISPPPRAGRGSPAGGRAVTRPSPFPLSLPGADAAAPAALRAEGWTAEPRAAARPPMP